MVEINLCIPTGTGDQSEGSLSNTATNSRLGDRFSADKEYALKARKPYTITKQREKWTQEEHKKFLEALKLYGRSWRQIEEHVGNKTAVQIRSHAQKFFSKVVRESSGADGTQVRAINIPPPRAKRKPTRPYPRKLSVPLKKRDGPVRSTCHDPSRSNHESMTPSWPISVSTQTLKLFGKTVFVTGSTQCYLQDGKNDEFGNKGEKSTMGFVPYKGCLAEESSMSAGEEGV